MQQCKPGFATYARTCTAKGLMLLRRLYVSKIEQDYHLRFNFHDGTVLAISCLV
jgi:hypothetical protein